MDHIRWDSDAYGEYTALLSKAYRSLENETQHLSDARKRILQLNSDGSDQALNKILLVLNNCLKRVENAAEKTRRLCRAVESANDLFSNAEKRIGDMGTNMLYSTLTDMENKGVKSPLVFPVSMRFQGGEIHPEWLYSLSGKSEGANQQ